MAGRVEAHQEAGLALERRGHLPMELGWRRVEPQLLYDTAATEHDIEGQNGPPEGARPKLTLEAVAPADERRRLAERSPAEAAEVGRRPIVVAAAPTVHRLTWHGRLRQG